MLLKVLIALCLVLAVVAEPPVIGSELCHSIESKDCSVYEEEVVCGSDFKTYRNSCEFAKGICSHHGHSLHAVHFGPCQ
ncbi:ovomucoid-like [Ylistrum balloti]|uniref:ovomucoid-like n=1 Tax=Ylistrum balloti TaxID=509963 RepID=UPI002905B7B5|nr:ovomucoid-like [Ylistrum balloti]